MKQKIGLSLFAVLFVFAGISLHSARAVSSRPAPTPTPEAAVLLPAIQTFAPSTLIAEATPAPTETPAPNPCGVADCVVHPCGTQDCSPPADIEKTINDADCAGPYYLYLHAASDGWPMGYRECLAPLTNTIPYCVGFHHDGTWDYIAPNSGCPTGYDLMDVDRDVLG